jgi:hypothetical protein
MNTALSTNPQMPARTVPLVDAINPTPPVQRALGHVYVSSLSSCALPTLISFHSSNLMTDTLIANATADE